MPSYALIHPILGALTIIAVVVAAAARLLFDDADTLHYAAGFTALGGVIISVVIAFIVVGRLYDAGIDLPGILTAHMIVGLLALVAVLVQAGIGIVMWRGGEEQLTRFLPIHGLVGPAIAILMFIQGGLGFATLAGLLS